MIEWKEMYECSREERIKWMRKASLKRKEKSFCVQEK